MRQSAEWGMRAFQSSMPRIKDRMKFEERGERKVTLTMMVFLYNFRARMVGINQLNSFYAGPLDRDANLNILHRYYEINLVMFHDTITNNLIIIIIVLCIILRIVIISPIIHNIKTFTISCVVVISSIIHNIKTFSYTIAWSCSIMMSQHGHHNHRHHILLCLHLLTLHFQLQTEFFASFLSFRSPFIPIRRLVIIIIVIIWFTWSPRRLSGDSLRSWH